METLQRSKSIAGWIFWTMIGAGFVYIALCQSVSEISRGEMVFLVVANFLILWRLQKYVYKNHIFWCPYGDEKQLAKSTSQKRKGDNDG